VGGLLSVALSLESPPPGVTRHRVSVEPGLSSIGTRKCKQRPSDRLALGVIAQIEALREKKSIEIRQYQPRKRKLVTFIVEIPS